MTIPYFPLFRYNFRFRGKKYCDWALSIVCNEKGEIKQFFSVTVGAFDLEKCKFKFYGEKFTSEFLEKVNEALREIGKSQRLVKVYTATNDEERAKLYRKGIFVIQNHLNGNKINHDAGDLGSGCYTDRRLYRARFYGRYIFRLTIDETRILDLGCPYDINSLSEDWLKPLFYDERGRMKTVQLSREERIKASQEIREAILKRGYLGAKWGNEIVLFSNEAIIKFEEIKRNGRIIVSSEPSLVGGSETERRDVKNE